MVILVIPNDLNHLQNLQLLGLCFLYSHTYCHSQAPKAKLGKALFSVYAAAAAAPPPIPYNQVLSSQTRGFQASQGLHFWYPGSPRLLDITPRPRPYTLGIKPQSLGMSSKAPRDLKFEMQIPGQTHAPWPWSKSIKTPRPRPYSPTH